MTHRISIGLSTPDQAPTITNLISATGTAWFLKQRTLILTTSEQGEADALVKAMLEAGISLSQSFRWINISAN